MDAKEWLEVSKTYCEQARSSAAIAHEAIADLVNSKRELVNSMVKTMGVSHSKAQEMFMEMMQEHSEVSVKALEHMDKMNAEYMDMLIELKK